MLNFYIGEEVAVVNTQVLDTPETVITKMSYNSAGFVHIASLREAEPQWGYRTANMDELKVPKGIYILAENLRKLNKPKSFDELMRELNTPIKETTHG